MTVPRPAAAPPQAPAGSPYPGRALTVCLIAAFMTLLDVSAVDVALPSIRLGLHAGTADLQWILTGYALTFGLALVPAGRLGDTIGHRPVFLAGLAAFVLTSTLAALATSPTFLIAARLTQGLAAGILNPQIIGFIQQLFRGPARGRAFGLLGTTIGASTALGPLLAGALIALGGTHDGWRYLFLLNLPLGITALTLTPAWLPAPTAHHDPGNEQCSRLVDLFREGARRAYLPE